MTVISITSAPGFAAQAGDASVKILNLPVAPLASHRLRHLPEGKSVQALSPQEALMTLASYEGLERVELEGPGDPLSSPAQTLKVITLVRQQHPSVAIGLTTLGLGCEQHAEELAGVGLNSVTLLVETLNATTAEKLYAWIRPGKKTVPLKTIIPVLLEEQIKAVQVFSAAGVTVSIRTTILPGINAHQVVNIAKTMAEYGARKMELVPFVPDPQQTDGPTAPTRVHMGQIGELTAQYLPTSSRQVTVEECGCSSKCGCGAANPEMPGLPRPTASRQRVAVVSTTGMDVDLHLGQAKTILIYGPREDGLTCLLETRRAPEAGVGDSRWDQMAETLDDCFALLAASAGQRPREVLGSHGIRVILTDDNIEGTVDVLYGGGKKQKCKN